ncbi:transposable element Tcb2 transposase [Trichonephila clavipes]|nr:transposable element Tcb2 transposase [Trichonephila clavipes]
MSSRHHIDDFMRGRIIRKIEEGRKKTDVAREFDIAHSVVSRLWESFKTTGMCSRRHGRGRGRRKQISRKTVARRLRGGGLYARTPVVCVPLTRQHRTARLQWCRKHHNWTEQDWACVLFSDESRFSLSSDCRRQLIWRESGTAYRPENIQEKDRYPTCSIMVRAGIIINSRTRLHVVANGTMTGQRYIDEVLLPHVRLFRGAVGDKFVIMDDNATCHRTLAVQNCLDSEGIQRLVWPAHSPNLNSIENVWDALGRQVADRNYPPTNKNTLIGALTEELDKFPQHLLDNVVQSMVRRVECCITLHGGHIPQAPGGALSIKADSVVQTTISRLASGHIRGLSFHLGQKIYENCTKCNLVQATPDHFLFCAGLDREDIYSSPLLVTWVVEREKFYDPVRSLLKSKNQDINRLQLAVKLPWAIFFESVDILS